MILGQRVRSVHASAEGRIDMLGFLAGQYVVHVTWDDDSAAWFRGSQLYDIDPA